MPKKEDHTGSGAAIAGAGGVTSAAGLAAGGIPGTNAKSEKIGELFASGSGKGGKLRRTASTARAKSKALPALKAGVGGYRHDAHKKWTKGHIDEQNHYNKETPLSELNRTQAFQRGTGAGKIGPEHEIMGHMKRLRTGGRAALVAGTAATAYGVDRASGGKYSEPLRERLKKRDEQRGKKAVEDASGAALGAGAATAGLAAGGEKALAHQSRKWLKRSGESIDASGKLIPKVGGHRTDLKRGMVFPKVKDSHIERQGKKILAGQTKAVSHAAGELHGKAGQESYFGRQYLKNSKMIGMGKKPGLILAGAGATGLAATKGKEAYDRHHVAKRNMSDAEIRRRKKAQGHLSQVTGALGLAALGGTLAASRSGRTAMRKIPALKSRVAAPKPLEADRDRIKGATVPILATSAGLGGAGAFNFAAYTGAESRKKNMKSVSKSAGVGMDAPHFGEVGTPVSPAVIEQEIEKAWSPSASNYDSEANRSKRNKGYEGASLVGAGAGGAYAAHQGMHALREAKKVKRTPMARVKETKINSAGDKRTGVAHIKGGNVVTEAAIPTKDLGRVARRGGKALAGLAVVGAAAGANKKIRQKREGDWQPYSKRDGLSAFGVDHL